MTKNITTTTTLTSKDADKTQTDLFDHFCELVTRMFMALEEEEWATEAGWDVAYGRSVSDADAAWKLVALQADTVTAMSPLSANDLLLHRLAGLVRRALAATNLAELEIVQKRAMHCLAQAPMSLARPVEDLGRETVTSIDQMIEHVLTCDGDQMSEHGLPLAA